MKKKPTFKRLPDEGRLQKRAQKSSSYILHEENTQEAGREKLKRSKKRQLSRLCFLTRAKETNRDTENFQEG